MALAQQIIDLLQRDYTVRQELNGCVASVSAGDIGNMFLELSELCRFQKKLKTFATKQLCLY